MQDKPISTRQLAFIIFLLFPGSSLVFLTGNAAGQDAWIATLLASGFGLYILHIIIKLHNMFPGQRITQISTTVLGKIPGNLLNLVFIWSVFIILVGFLFDFIMYLEVLYPHITETILYPLLVLPCAYCLYKGLIILSRLSELCLWITLAFITIGLLVALPIVNLNNLQPILEAWKPLAAGTLYAADWPFDEVIIFALFLPLVSDLQEKKSQLYWGYLLSALLLTLLDLLVIAILGAKLVDISQFPLFDVSLLIGTGDFQRMEMLFFILWFITGIITIMVYYKGLGCIVQDIFFLKTDKSLILPLGLCLIVFTLYMFPSTVVYRQIAFNYIPVYTFPVNLLYPTIILLAAKFQQKRVQQNAARGA